MVGFDDLRLAGETLAFDLAGSALWAISGDAPSEDSLLWVFAQGKQSIINSAAMNTRRTMHTKTAAQRLESRTERTVTKNNFVALSICFTSLFG